MWRDATAHCATVLERKINSRGNKFNADDCSFRASQLIIFSVFSDGESALRVFCALKPIHVKILSRRATSCLPSHAKNRAPSMRPPPSTSAATFITLQTQLQRKRGIYGNSSKHECQRKLPAITSNSRSYPFM